MPRQARKKSATGIYHVMLRGINKQNIFEDDEDKRKFLETIKYYKEISKYELYCYCLMDNHIHLLVKEMGEPISDIVKRISSSYVYWYNQKYARCGHLFQERFRSETVEEDAYFLIVLRYIHQNPVKGGITTGIKEYFWSSYGEYMGDPVFTDVDFALKMFSIDRVKAIQLFQKYMNEENKDQCLEYNQKTAISDQEVMNYIHKLGLGNICELQRLKKEQRDKIIRDMKKVEGITIRQLARVTGISKSVIDRS